MMNKLSLAIVLTLFSIQSLADYTTLKSECAQQVNKSVSDIVASQSSKTNMQNSNSMSDVGLQLLKTTMIEDCVGEKINQDILNSTFKICPKEDLVNCIYKLVKKNTTTSSGFIKSVVNIITAGTTEAKLSSDPETIQIKFFSQVISMMEDVDAKKLLEYNINVKLLNEAEKKSHDKLVIDTKENLNHVFDKTKVLTLKHMSILETKLALQPALEIENRKFKSEMIVILRERLKNLESKFPAK